MADSREHQGDQQDDTRVDPVVWRIGAVTVLGSVMSVLDTTIVNVALDALARDLGSSVAGISWVVTSYLLALAAAVPCAGWAARRFGTRRTYLVALLAFLVGSLLCGLAWSTGSLVAARVVQGLGGGLLLPVGTMITVRSAGGRNLGQVMGVLAVPTVLAPVFGPTLGGVLIEHVGWQAIFLINLPIGVVAVVAGLRILPRDTPVAPGRLDAVGLLLVVPGLSLLTLGLAEGGQVVDLLSPRTLAPLVVGLLLLAAFVPHAARSSAPLLDVRLFQGRAYAAAALAAFVNGTVVLGGLILLPFYFQGVRGEGPTDTGLLMAPTAIGVVLVLRWAGRRADRIGGGLVALGGVLLLALGTVPFLFLDEDTPYWLLLLGMLVRGLGVGMCGTPLTSAALRTLRPESVGDGSAQLNVVQRVGGSVGTAVFTVLLQRRAGGGDAAAEAAAYGWTFRWVLVATLLSLVPVLVLVLHERRERQSPPPPSVPVQEPPVVVAATASGTQRAVAGG